MATLRVSEVHQQGAILERVVLSDDDGPLLFRRTNPFDGDAVLEERPATEAEQARFDPPPFVTLSQAEVAAMPVGGNGPVATVQAILTKADADITQAELKTIVLLIARYFLRKWLSGWR